MPQTPKSVFKILFKQHDELIELHAHGVNQSSLMAFIEVTDLIFQPEKALLINPSEEKLKAQFGHVKTTYIPMHNVVRIDEVTESRSNKIRAITPSQDNTVTPFPRPKA